jgi:hypothetical protein
MRFVLTWAESGQDETDLDLLVDFQINKNFICSIGFYLPEC